MPPGPEYFKDKEVPLRMKIIGTVNKKKFNIFGTGAGDARIGKLEGRWILTKPTKGPCPMSWAVLAPTFAYGYKVFAKYPDNVPHFFQNCFPNGYTQRRITRFTRMMGNDDVAEEGWMETYHEVIFREGYALTECCWQVHNTVQLTAEFKEGSPLLENDGATIFLQSLERTVPCGDGVKNYVQYFYPIKDDPNGDIIIATQMTHNRPHCTSCSAKRKKDHMHRCEHLMDVELPPAHFKRTECKQWRDPTDEREHVCQDEINQHFSFAHEGVWTEIGQESDDEEDTHEHACEHHKEEQKEDHKKEQKEDHKKEQKEDQKRRKRRSP